MLARPVLNLEALGWDPGFEALFEPHRARGCEPARVAVEDKHAYRVAAAAGEGLASVAGRLLHQARSEADLPKVGDWVAWEPQGPHKNQGVIHAVLPRRTRLSRKLAGREAGEQVLAANVDLAFVVQGLDRSFNLRRLERFLVMAHEGGSQPVVLLNKADLCPDADQRLAETRRVAGSAPVLLVSAQTGLGLADVRRLIAAGQTVVFIGSSGVGKSSLINQLYGEEIQATLEVREHDAKGRHTTAWRELILLPGGGLVIDTPGMREFHMWVAHEGLEEAFPDIGATAAGCRFRDCTHTSEDRCAVKQAVAEGTLAPDRYRSFLKLHSELRYLAEERLEHTYLARRRRARTGGGRPRPNDDPPWREGLQEEE